MSIPPCKKPCPPPSSYSCTIVKYNVLSEQIKEPKRATDGSAGYDLCSIFDYKIPPNERVLVRTGLFLEIPTGFYARIASRSGLALKEYLDVKGGVIDSDYRGEIKVILHNAGKTMYHVTKGDRIAQLIFEKCYYPVFQLAESLNGTIRGQNGFGSTTTSFALN